MRKRRGGFLLLQPSVLTFERKLASGEGKAIEYVIAKFYPRYRISAFISYREGYAKGMGALKS